MGQKVNASGLRVGINRGWESDWYATKKEYAKLLAEDIKIREYLEPQLKEAVVSHIDIGRVKTSQGYVVNVNAFVARPGVVIGQADNVKVTEITDGLKKIIKSGEVKFTVVEVKNPDLDATLLGKWIASELENRQSFRSTQKKAMIRAKKAGAAGIRTQCQGRLGGAEIARREGYKDGVVPLETLRADIEYASISAATAYGRIGVKVWICRNTNKPGSVVGQAQAQAPHENRGPRRPREGGREDASAKEN